MLEICKLYTVIEFVIEFDSFSAVIHAVLVYKTTYDQTTGFSCTALTLWVEWHEGQAAEKNTVVFPVSPLCESKQLWKRAVTRCMCECIEFALLDI